MSKGAFVCYFSSVACGLSCRRCQRWEGSDWAIAQKFDVRSFKEKLFRSRPLQPNSRIVGRRYGGGIEARPGLIILLPPEFLSS